MSQNRDQRFYAFCYAGGTMIISFACLLRVFALVFEAADITSIQPDHTNNVVRGNVVLTSGVDAQPGQAGIDDDFDGVIDNDSELGAFGSDDFCVTEYQFKQLAINDPFARVVSKR